MSARCSTRGVAGALVGALVAAALAALTACTNLSLPEGAQVSCSDDDECPPGFVCRRDAERCIDESIIGKTPIDFEQTPTLAPVRIGDTEGFNVATLRASFTEEPVQAPIVSVLEHEVSCEGTQQIECTIDAAELALPEGALEVRVVARDAAANEAEAALPLFVDRTAPAVADAPPALLEAAPDNAIARPAAMTRGTTARVTVALTELLGVEPSARIAGTDVALVRLDEDGLADPVFTFAWTFAADDVVSDGPQLVELSLQDTVGNDATVEVDAGIVVDTQAPAAPAVETPGTVVYRRAPWGRAGDAAAHFEVVGAGGLEAGLLVEARSHDDDGALVLGRAPTNDDGSFTLPLLAVDVPRVFLVIWDQAGNASAPARVRDIEWTAGFARKVVGSRLDNPHALYRAARFAGTALEDELEDELDPAPLLDVGSAPLEVAGGARWTERRRSSSNLPNRGDAAVAYHAALGRTVVFGGYDNSIFTAVDDTFLIDGDIFEELVLEVRPPPGRARMSYDSRRDRLVLQAHFDRSTWVFEEDRWRPLLLDDPGVAFDALAYDPLLDAVVGFAGWSETPSTWLLAGEGWQEVDAAGPSGRDDVAMAWDANEQRVLLHGGETYGDSQLLGDLWAFDGQAWQHLADGPTLKMHAGLTGPDGALWLVGGEASCDPDFVLDCIESQTVYHWQGVGAGFVVVSTAPAAMPVPLGAQLGASWEDARNRLVTFGGGTDVGVAGLIYRAEHWVWEAGVWRRVTPAAPTTIGARHDFPPLLYDPGRAGLILAGGYVVSGAAGIHYDTQLLAGDTVTELSDDFDAFGYYGAEHSTPLFRSPLGVTLINNGSTGYLAASGWVLSGASTPARTEMAAAYDEGRNLTFLFGGFSSVPTSETRRFNGSSYTTLAPATVPPARRAAVMTYDPIGARVLMFGGADAAGARHDTWAFNGTDWSLVASDGPTLGSANLLFDRSRGLPILVGDEGTTVAVYELVDGAWRAREVEGIDGTLGSASAGFDVSRGLITLAGGSSVNGSTDRVFTWDGSPELRAALIAQVDLRVRGAADSAVLERLSVEAEGGARGFDGADARAGASVLVWRGGWESLGDNTAGPDAPAALVATLDDAAALAALDPARLHLAVAASASNGARQSAATLRSLAITLRYREP
ncbi:MAG: hypothetical protein IT383_23385 [Deltaproteobacteria bacterium]|nr:hypothetical protein [Deltaproteobacteria bacterium]